LAQGHNLEEFLIMREMLIVLAVAALVANSALAESYVFDREIITVTATATNADTAVVGTITGIRGAIEEIMIDLDTATTATVVVAVSPELSTMTGYNLYAGTDITSDIISRIRVDGNDSTGSALTSDDPWRPVVAGDTITVTVSDFDATNKVVNAVIKYRK
jgi:hypothetical protein